MNATLDIITPEKWRSTCLWSHRGRIAFAFVIAFSPTVLSFGVELITGNAKGAAVMFGPFWIGFAGLKLSDNPS